MNHHPLPRIFVFLLLAAAEAACAEPPFENSIVSTDFDFITDDDPTTFESLRLIERGRREMPDKRSDELFANGVFDFEARFDDNCTVRIWAHADFGAETDAENYATMAAERLGKLPQFMRKKLSHVVIHKGDETAFAEEGGRFFVLYSDNMDTRVRNHDLEETIFHEAVHATLEKEYAKRKPWKSAQKADPGFITKYAERLPAKEDLPESAVFAYTMLKHPGRLPESVEAKVREIMPNRLEFFRDLFGEMGALPTLVNPPNGRLAIVADGNSPDPDDIGATAVIFGLLSAAGQNERLVHLSHSCDLKPFKTKAKQTIDATNEKRRQEVLHQLCVDGIAHFGPFPNLKSHFNCRADQVGAVNDLRDAINASTADDPLWIIEAGEPDIIGYALQAAEASKLEFVHVVSHHPANDDSGDFFTWKQILAFGITEHQIGDQNAGLKTAVQAWDWAKNHPNEGIAWIHGRLEYAEQDGVVKFQANHFDCSDAGMVYWWLTGADQGGNKNATPAEMKTLLLLTPLP